MSEHIIVTGSEETLSELDAMHARASDLYLVMGRAAEILVDEVKRHLEEQQSPRGTFQALSPNYAKWKAQHFPGKTILRATDDLYRSVSSDAKTDRAEAGPVGIAYAAVHNYGGGNNIPQRQYAWIHDDTGQVLEDLTVDYVMTGVVN